MMLRRQHEISTMSLARALLISISCLPAFHSRPTSGIQLFDGDDGFPIEDPAGAAFWWKLGISIILVLLGGVFAGTIGIKEAHQL